MKVRESVSVEIRAGHWSLAARGSRRSALMQKRGMSRTIALWENWGKEQGIFSGLFGIIEVRPSDGVCVDVGHTVGGGIWSLSRSGSH